MKIGEQFYSIQGEGPTAGIPAYFIRLAGCNLICGGGSGTGTDPTWVCDSINQWKTGVDTDNGSLVKSMEDAGVFQDILNGRVSIVWTGGEPMLQAGEIRTFLHSLPSYGNPVKVVNEIETNGTVIDNIDFLSCINVVNCSPKLSNSGMPIERRFIPAALSVINEHPGSVFKFVISNESDIQEIHDQFIHNPCVNISEKKVLLMPAVTRRDDLAERTRFVFEMAKYRLRAVTRQHILAWDKTVGV